MATRARQLATMLETIIHAYYEKLGDSTVTLESTATEEIENLDEYIHIDTAEVNIDDFIGMAVAKKRGCERAPLMHYLAYGIKLLNELQESPKPLDRIVLEHTTDELTQLMINLQSLLSVPKTGQIRVKYNEQELSIHGYAGCRSGVIIQKVLLLPLNHISGRVNEYISDIVNAHQVALLAQENRELKTDMELIKSQLISQEFDNKRLQSEALCYSRVMLAQLNEIETMRKQLADSQQTISRAQERTILSPSAPPIYSRNRGSIFHTIGALRHEPASAATREKDSPVLDFLSLYG